jgi:hypothetical protein
MHDRSSWFWVGTHKAFAFLRRQAVSQTCVLIYSLCKVHCID